MGMENFKRKAKEAGKIIGAASLSIVPPQQLDKTPNIDKSNETRHEIAQEEKTENQELDSNLYNEYAEKLNTNKEKKYYYETFIPQERITETVETLREKISEEIPEKIKKHYDGRFSKHEKIYSHDHEILTLGNNENFTTEDYLKLIAETGDSLYFYKKPTISFEGYLLNENLKLLPEEEAEKLEQELKDEYDSLLKINDPSVQGIDYKYFSKHRRKWLTKDAHNTWKNKYDAYVERNDYSETRELHTGSTIYALLRSGAYDNFVAQGGNKEKLAQNMLRDLSNPKYYQYDSIQGENVHTGKYFSERHEVAWILATCLELKKRGINPEIYFGDKDSANINPISIEKLAEINKEQLDFTLDTTDFDEKFDRQKDSRSLPINTESACGGSHALHALTMYDIYKKDTVSLDSHLNLAKSMIEKTLLKSDEILKGNFNENKSAYEDVIHTLSHELLSFTELPEDFLLDPEMKKTAQKAISRMIEFTKILEGQEKMEVNDMSHVLDVLEHLPRCVLEK